MISAEISELELGARSLVTSVPMLRRNAMQVPVELPGDNGLAAGTLGVSF